MNGQPAAEAPADPTRLRIAAEHSDPPSSRRWKRLARALEAEGDETGAESAWRRALELRASDADASLALGRLLIRVGKPGEAATQLRASAAVSPDWPPCWLLLSRVLEQTGDETGSRDACRRLLELEPGHPEALRRLHWLDFRLERSRAPRAGEARREAGLRLARRLIAQGPSYPLKHVRDVLERVETPAELKRGGNRYLLIDPGGEPIGHPPGIGWRGDGAEVVTATSASGPAWVAGLDDAMVVGPGAVLTANGDLLADVTSVLKPWKFKGRQRDGRFTFDASGPFGGEGPVRVFDTPAFLMTGPTDRTYGDWINNYPTRLALAEAAELDCPILVRTDPVPRFIRMLKLMGVAEERIIAHDVSGVSMFPRLYVPSWPLGHRMHPMKDLYGAYRRLPPPRSGGSRELVYLSRSGIGNRPLANEDEIQPLFERRGFRIVRPETLDLPETVELFARPACVAGPYGSGFRGMVLGSEPPAALAIMPPYPDDYLPGVALWMGQLGVRLALVRGEPVADESRRLPNVSPWTVSARDVELALDAVLDVISRERMMP